MGIKGKEFEETYRLMRVFGYLNEAPVPSTTPTSSTSAGAYRSTPAAPETGLIPVDTTKKSEDETTGVRREPKDGGLGLLALKDWGWHFNQFIGRPIEYRKDGLAGLEPGTIVLKVTVKGKKVVSESEMKQQSDKNDANLSFHIEVGERETLVIRTPKGDYITMCSINQNNGQQERNVSGDRKKNDPSLDYQFGKAKNNFDKHSEENPVLPNKQANNESRLYEAKNDKNVNMIHEPVDRNNNNSGGIVRMGKFWLFIRVLAVGADVRLAGLFDGGDTVAEIHPDFAEWFACQPKESQMPMPKAHQNESDFGRYVHSALTKSGDQQRIANNPYGFSIVKYVTQDHMHRLMLNVNLGENIELGAYSYSEFKPVDEGYEGYLHCGDQYGNLIGFRYVREQQGVMFYVVHDRKTSRWQLECQGILVDLIMDYCNKEDNGENVHEEEKPQEKEKSQGQNIFTKLWKMVINGTDNIIGNCASGAKLMVNVCMSPKSLELTYSMQNGSVAYEFGKIMDIDVDDENVLRIKCEMGFVWVEYQNDGLLLDVSHNNYTPIEDSMKKDDKLGKAYLSIFNL